MFLLSPEAVLGTFAFAPLLLVLLAAPVSIAVLLFLLRHRRQNRG